MLSKYLLRTILGIVAFVTLAGGCGDDDADDGPVPTAAQPSPTASPERTVARTAAVTPPAPSVPRPSPTIVPGRSTGRPAFDRLAELVQIPDIPSLVAAVKYTELACTTQQGIGGPPKCLAGEASGTRVMVMPMLACEGEHVRPDLVDDVFRSQLRSPKLYSAFSLKGPFDPNFPLGEYGLVFEVQGPQGPAGLMYGVDPQGRIVSLVRLCGGSAADLATRYQGSEVLLAPPR